MRFCRVILDILVILDNLDKLEILDNLVIYKKE